ncbi:hypothetical protein IJX73_02550 [bacterium]|nr:hypothetical protein [bacterium]
MAFAFFSMLPIQAEENTSEIDILRAELSFIKDKNSPQYVKTKQKLEKLISKNKITYTNEARFADTQRLIYEQKYNSAIWELNELIENGYQPSKCNEFLADISQKLEKPAKKSAQYYKIALQYDNQNSSARFKLAKLYLQEGKNILAIENFRQVVVDTKNDSMLLK